MKRVSLGVLAAASLVAALAAGPALAQPYDRGDGWDRDRGGDYRRGDWDLGRRIDWIQQRIDAGRADGSLRWDEARRAQNRLNEIRQMVRNTRDRGRGWINPHDRDVLFQRLDDLSDKVRRMRHNDDRRPW